MKYQLRNIITITVLVLFFSLMSSCKKFVDVDIPATKVSELSVYKSDATAIAVLTGLYASLSNTTPNNVGFQTLTKFAGLSSDELTLYPAVSSIGIVSYYTNKLSSQAATGVEMWNNLYPHIYTVNAAIEGLSAATELTPSIKKQLQGEAYFMRGLFYFYLVNLYGKVPLVLDTKYEVNRLKPRASVDSVYNQIVSDLIQAKYYLSEKYFDGTLLKESIDRVRPSKYSAAALLSRVYLHLGQWQNAFDESNYLINNPIFDLPNVSVAFHKNSKEAIWQLQPVLTGFNTQYAVQYVLPVAGPNLSTNYVYLSDDLVNDFEPGDLRRSVWIGKRTVSGISYYYSNKYVVNTSSTSVTSVSAMTEYLDVLRMGEQFLINSESALHLGRKQDAINSINRLRSRARAVPDAQVPNPLPPILITVTEDELAKIIAHERRAELFVEWGDRWIDLKRTNKIDSVMNIAASKKGTTWESYQKLYPVPAAEILKNGNLDQNTGYN